MPISLEVEVLREGKAVSTLLGRAVQGGQVVTLVQGSFGAGRPSGSRLKRCRPWQSSLWSNRRLSCPISRV